MKPRIRLMAPFLGAIVMLALPAARADELKLKDGSKIVGTIVGYEEDSFKVQTSYGYAVIKKDQVLSINITGAQAAPIAIKDAAKDSGKAPVNDTTKSPISNTAEKKPEVEKTAPPTLAKTPAPEKPKPVVAASKPAVPAEGVVTVPPPTAVAANTPPPRPVASEPIRPEPIREDVTGNVYTNLTYGFRMFKPPSWNVIAAAPSVLPGAIAAMGTQDEATYLLVGQSPMAEGPTAKILSMAMDATERRLRNVLENFRPLDEQQITVSGIAAVEDRFRGSVDERDWSGIVVIVPHGQKIYTIFGMTRADTDLVQIQENVISRTIASLQFIPNP